MARIDSGQARMWSIMAKDRYWASKHVEYSNSTSLLAQYLSLAIILHILACPVSILGHYTQEHQEHPTRGRSRDEDVKKHGTKRLPEVTVGAHSGRSKVPRLLGPILAERFKALNVRVARSL